MPWEMQLRSLHTGSGLGEPDGGLIGAEEKVINSKNKVDENMVSHFSLLPCPVFMWRIMRVRGLVSGALQVARVFHALQVARVFLFRTVAGGWAPAAPTIPVFSLWV